MDKQGQISTRLLIFIIIGVVAIMTLLPMVQVATISGAIARLEGQGYVVLAAGEYALIAKEATASAAVIAAQTAAAKVDLFNAAQRLVYPETTAETCTLTAGGVANTFGAWVEITDSGATTLSTAFAASAGYLNELTPYLYSAANKLYIVEIAYGAVKVNVARLRWYARADALIVLPVFSAKIPAGETVYYRMMCETAGATCLINLRYFYE